jgi:hypothetical protein
LYISVDYQWQVILKKLEVFAGVYYPINEDAIQYYQIEHYKAYKFVLFLSQVPVAVASYATGKRDGEVQRLALL